jgi:serine/threonine protein kinase
MVTMSMSAQQAWDATPVRPQGWRPGWREVVALALDVAAGVAAIHAAGILHRDIKTSNLLLCAPCSARPCISSPLCHGLISACTAASHGGCPKVERICITSKGADVACGTNVPNQAKAAA